MTIPIQPMHIDAHGVLRFKVNAVIDRLFMSGRLDLNRDLQGPSISDDDRAQIAMLLGYSLGGFSELSYVSDELYERVQQNAIDNGLLETDGGDSR